MTTTLCQDGGQAFPVLGRMAVAHWVLPSTELAPARARRALRSALASLPVSDDHADDALTAVSELVTNAVAHAPGPHELRVYLGRGLLVCEVRDGDPTLVRFPTDPAQPDAESGRGLLIVAGLTGGLCGSRPLPTGKAVWFALPARLRRGVGGLSEVDVRIEG